MDANHVGVSNPTQAIQLIFFERILPILSVSRETKGIIIDLVSEFSVYKTLFRVEITMHFIDMLESLPYSDWLIHFKEIVPCTNLKPKLK